MQDSNTEKLKKLLELTASTNDNEALVAIRKANEFLKNSGKTWSSLIASDSVDGTRYEQLLSKFKALLNEYKILVASYNNMVAQRQVVLVPAKSPRKVYRRRF